MRTDGEIRVYHVGGPLRRYLVWLIFGPFAAAIAVAGVASKGPDRTAGWLISGFLLLMAMAMHWLVSRARLEISATGLKLRQTGYTLEALWTNVESLRMEKGHEGFVTKDAMKSRGAELLASMRGVAFGIGRMPLYDSTSKELLYERRFIPIEAFAWHVRHGKLSGDLQRLAPHVQISAAAHAAHAELTPKQRRKNLIVLTMIFGFTALVLVAAFFTPPAAYRHIIPGTWALLATSFALQAAWFARVTIRTGPKWMAILYILLAIVLGLWSATLWGEAITGKAPPKRAAAATSSGDDVRERLQTIAA